MQSFWNFNVISMSLLTLLNPSPLTNQIQASLSPDQTYSNISQPQLPTLHKIQASSVTTDQAVHAIDDIHDIHPIDHVSDVFPVNDVDHVDHVDDVTDVDLPQYIESRVQFLTNNIVQFLLPQCSLFSYKQDSFSSQFSVSLEVTQIENSKEL